MLRFPIWRDLSRAELRVFARTCTEDFISRGGVILIVPFGMHGIVRHRFREKCAAMGRKRWSKARIERKNLDLEAL